MLSLNVINELNWIFVIQNENIVTNNSYLCYFLTIKNYVSKLVTIIRERI